MNDTLPKTSIDEVHEIIWGLGGTDVSVRRLPDAGLVAVRFKNPHGLWETRFGISGFDLLRRMKRIKSL